MQNKSLRNVHIINLKPENKNMDIFFDTETNGLPKNWNASVTDIDNWPRLVESAWIAYDDEGNELSSATYIIKPAGFEISPTSAEIHGISQEKALKEGVDLEIILAEFGDLLSKAEKIIAHNIAFDENIVGAELLRCGMENIIPSITKICTMKETTDFCAISGYYGYKWPTLRELYFTLFKKDFENAHNALSDVKATAECFWELTKIVKSAKQLKLF